MSEMSEVVKIPGLRMLIIDLSGGWVVGLHDAVLSEGCSAGSLGIDIFLTRAVDGYLDSDFTTLDCLSVHLIHRLLLELFRAQGNESESTTFTGLAASLELGDHEARDRSEGNLGSSWAVGREEFLKL